MNFFIENRLFDEENTPPKKNSRRSFITRSLLGVGAFAVSASVPLGCAHYLPRPRRPVRTKYNTIAHKMLDLELVHQSDPTAYQTLDQFLSVTEYILKAQPSAEEDRTAAGAVQSLVMIDKILKFLSFEYQKNGLLTHALRTRRIDCDGYSALYLAVGEILDLPIKMVRAPAHTFIRWQLENGKYINWETTIGAVKSDGYYITKHNIARKARGKTALRSLDIYDNRDEVLANTYVNIGVDWLKKLQYERALACFDKAIEGDALYETPYYNKGLVYFHMGDMNRAVEWCERAVSLNPNHMKSHAVLGTAYKELNKSQKARLHFRRVRELDPEYYAVKIMELQISDAAPKDAEGAM